VRFTAVVTELQDYKSANKPCFRDLGVNEKKRPKKCVPKSASKKCVRKSASEKELLFVRLGVRKITFFIKSA
jgi:hypothetical protein